MIATIIILCVVGACAVAAIVFIVRRKIKNKGKCSGCGGACYGCPSYKQSDCGDRIHRSEKADGKLTAFSSPLHPYIKVAVKFRNTNTSI